MAKQKTMSKNKKLFWIIFSIILSLAVVYMFVVIYFYYISPTNISLKLAVWPFNSDKAIGEMYGEATVQVDFEFQDPESGQVSEKSAVGVNVRENGVIIALYKDFRYLKQNSEITVSTSNGVYGADFVYGDINYNLAVFKCHNKPGRTGQIKIPYVNIASRSQVLTGQQVFVVSSPKEEVLFRKGTLLGSSKYVHGEDCVFSNMVGVDYVTKDGYVFAFSDASAYVDFKGGAIFDKAGNLYGFSVGYYADELGFVFVPSYNANKFLNKALAAFGTDEPYENVLLKNMMVVDLYDMDCHKQKNPIDGFYFSETRTWEGYTEQIEKYIDNRVDSVFLIKDFELNEETILPKGSVIVSIKLGGATYKIYDKLWFVDVLYMAEKGQKVIINYSTVDATEEILSKEVIL